MADGQGASDHVFIEGLRCYGYHGVHPEERALGQVFEIDIRLGADLRPAGRSDRLEDAISYSEVARRVAEIVGAEPRSLIEAVAESIAADLLTTYPRVIDAEVTVRKPHAPIQGIMFRAVGVSIQRSRARVGERGIG